MSELEHIIRATKHTFVFGGVEIRTFDIEGSRFVVGSDVCEALNITNPTDTMSRLDSEDKITLLRSDTLDTTEGIWENFKPQVQSIVLMTETGAKNLARMVHWRPAVLADVQGWFGAASPFDSIRRVRPDGTEYWSARDLMPLMGYSKWENFEKPIKRAMKTSENQGLDVDHQFMRSQKLAVQRRQGGGNAALDYELSRYAAYLVAMNGDPNIAEVAAAQHYFAVKTREAETRPALTEDEIVHQALAITARRVEALTAKVKELEPKAEAYDEFINSYDCLDMKEAGEYMGWGPNQILNRLREEKILRTGGSSHNLPYACYDTHFMVVPVTKRSTSGRVMRFPKTLIRPDSMDWVKSRIGMGPRKARPWPVSVF